MAGETEHIRGVDLDFYIAAMTLTGSSYAH
jgi:hypothetical protein